MPIADAKIRRSIVKLVEEVADIEGKLADDVAGRRAAGG
jgi:hypothetical protein